MNALELRRRTLGKGVYKKTVEGNPAIAQGSLARRYLGITMQGWTEQESTTGANLIDYTQAAARTENQSVEIIDGGIKWTGDYYFKIPVAGLKKNQNYIMSYESDDAGFWAFSYSDGTFSPGAPNGHSDPTDPEKDCSAVFIYKTRPTVAGQDMVFTNIMINEGSTALPYEPYTGGQPSPSPDYPQPITSAGKYDEETGKWDYEVKLTGKNMLPRYDSPSDWMPGGYFYIPIHGFIVGETYTASQQNLPEVGENFYVSIGTCAGNANAGVQHWLYHKSGGNLTKKSVSFKATQEVYYLNVADISSNGVSVDSTKLDKFLELFPDLMVEMGTERTEYVPYQEQTVTLTSDRPLTKWDRMEKRNGQWGWVYKSEEIESYTDESVPGEYFSTTGRLSTGAQVWYETTTETFVPLSESEQEQMNALHTFRPTTVLSNDCDCNMTLTYKTKKSLEVAT